MDGPGNGFSSCRGGSGVAGVFQGIGRTTVVVLRLVFAAFPVAPYLGN